MEKMRIMIMSCTDDSAWYKTLIGKGFNVLQITDSNYIVNYKGKKSIDKKDCVEV
jgi:hypothetical protein